jgi:hypothetical protein
MSDFYLLPRFTVGPVAPGTVRAIINDLGREGRGSPGGLGQTHQETLKQRESKAGADEERDLGRDERAETVAQPFPQPRERVRRLPQMTHRRAFDEAILDFLSAGVKVKRNDDSIPARHGGPLGKRNRRRRLRWLTSSIRRPAAVVPDGAAVDAGSVAHPGLLPGRDGRDDVPE